MAINYCTISNSSIDAFCGARRAVVLNALLERKYQPILPPLGTNNSSVSAAFAKQRPDLVRHVADDEDFKPMVFEQPWVTVSIVMDGKTYSQQVEAKQQLEFVSIHSLQHVEDAALDVNISDFRILP